MIKKQREKMMTEEQQQQQRELDDQLFHRRRRRWLIYGRAILTIASLGLLTVILYNLTHTTKSSLDDEESTSKSLFMNVGNVHAHKISSKSVSIEDETVRKLNNDETARKVKRNIVPKIIVNNVKSAEDEEYNDIQLNADEQHDEKLQRRATNHKNIRHRHSDGDAYYLRGYKCVPIKTSSSSSSRHFAAPSNLRLPGMFFIL
jgi:hypothetical protein